MGFTAFFVLFVFALFMIMIKVVIDEAKAKNWKKVVIVAVVFCAALVSLWYGFISFITSM